jgi:hypothetical protein
MRMLLLWSVVLLAGCSSPRAPRAVLTAEEASLRARTLANEAARTRYGMEPYFNGPRAKRVGDQWVWSDRRACSHGDMEATVRLASDGSPRTVQVNFLDSRVNGPW